MIRLGDPDPEADRISAASYRLASGAEPKVELWYEPLSIDQPLPTLPLVLKNGPAVLLPLEELYLEMLGRNRISIEKVREAASKRPE